MEVQAQVPGAEAAVGAWAWPAARAVATGAGVVSAAAGAVFLLQSDNAILDSGQYTSAFCRSLCPLMHILFQYVDYQFVIASF